jgi:thymidylate synthase (FAD)
MTVKIVGFTQSTVHIDDLMECDEDTSSAEDLIEFAGRACYQSFNKPNEATRSNKDYMANILAQGHESVLEHASVSFYVTGFSRNMLLELERHRHLSFSVISTRFVDAAKSQVVIPPALRLPDGPTTRPLDSDTIERYSVLVRTLMEAGATRKEAREAARWELPGNLETKFVVTGNLRAWRDVLKKRWHTAADAEIRLLADEILAKLREHAPNVFQDFPAEPFE